MTGSERGPRAFLRRLQRAVNDHDIEALVSCFAEDYVNETPAHPLRGFSGRDQVRKNWTQTVVTRWPSLSPPQNRRRSRYRDRQFSTPPQHDPPPEADLLAAGERIVRVPNVDGQRPRQRPRLRHVRPDRRPSSGPRRAGPDRDVRLLVEHREALIAERTRAINRFRRHRHELDPQRDPRGRSLNRGSGHDAPADQLNTMRGSVARLARSTHSRCRSATQPRGWPQPCWPATAAAP
jgi:hypothetical protein